MPQIQWISGSFGIIGPAPPAPAPVPSGSTVGSSGAVTGSIGARVVAASVTSRQLDVQGVCTAVMRVGFTEDFKVIPDADAPVTISATYILSGIATAYADGSVGAAPFIFPPAIPVPNRAEARVRGNVTAQVLQGDNTVFSFIYRVQTHCHFECDSRKEIKAVQCH